MILQQHHCWPEASQDVTRLSSQWPSMTIKTKHYMFDRMRSILSRYDHIDQIYQICFNLYIFPLSFKIYVHTLLAVPLSGKCTQFTSSTFESSFLALLVSQVQVPSNGSRRRVCPSKIQMKFLPFWMPMVVTLATVFGTGSWRQNGIIIITKLFIDYIYNAFYYLYAYIGPKKVSKTPCACNWKSCHCSMFDV